MSDDLIIENINPIFHRHFFFIVKGIQQSLFASYINGAKKPSKEREELIKNEIRALGEELHNVDW